MGAPPTRPGRRLRCLHPGDRDGDRAGDADPGRSRRLPAARPPGWRGGDGSGRPRCGHGHVPLEPDQHPRVRRRSGGARGQALDAGLLLQGSRSDPGQVEEAAEAGYEALLLTVDAPYAGRRERDLRTGFEVPAEIRAPAIEAAGGHRSLTPAELRPRRSINHLEGPRAALFRIPAADPRQGPDHRGGRRARGRARRRGGGGLKSWGPPARQRSGEIDALPEVVEAVVAARSISTTFRGRSSVEFRQVTLTCPISSSVRKMHARCAPICARFRNSSTVDGDVVAGRARHKS